MNSNKPAHFQPLKNGNLLNEGKGKLRGQVISDIFHFIRRFIDNCIETGGRSYRNGDFSSLKKTPTGRMCYILNEPCGVDGFHGMKCNGSASCVAEQIVNELVSPTKLKRTDGTSGDYPVSLIGLNGCWGSGKSNVLRIVKGTTQLFGKFVFFQYDFWGHREGLTRKMFLEELMDCLSDNNIALNKETKNALKALTGKTMERETQAKLSIPALFCGTSFVLLPILNLLARICKDEIAIGASFLSFVILCVFAITLVWDLCKGRVLCGAFSRLMGTFKGNAATCVDFEHEVEPSIGKFTRFLANVAKILKKNGKTLVVVLDNMDRLLPDEVMKCLASVHILFAEKREKWPSNLKVIVPYDATRIGKVFAKAMDTDRQTADDYFRRTFDVVYRLSPQLGSGWETFFDKCYDIVSEGDEISETGKSDVRKVLDYLVPVSERTPRKLISILNEIAAIRNTMKGLADDVMNLVRMKDIAVYVCAWPKCGLQAMQFSPRDGKETSKDEKEKSAAQRQETIDDLILGGGFIANSNYRDFLYAEDDKAKLAIAAIVYQVKDVREIILPKWLLTALTSGNRDRTGELSCMPGFLTAFRSVMMNDINIGNIDNVPRALEGLRTDQQAHWDEFYAAQKDALMTLHESNATMLQEFERITIKHITDYRGYAKRLRAKAEDLTKAFGIAVSIECALNERFPALTQVGPDKEDVTPGSFLDVLAVFQSNYEWMGQRCDWETLDSYCAPIIEKNDGCDLSRLYPLRYLKQTEAVKLQKTKKALQGRLLPTEMPQIDHYLGILENVSEDVLTCKFNSLICNTYVEWMNDPRNIAHPLRSGNLIPERVLSLTLRYGGNPYEQCDVKELLNDVSQVDGFLDVALHYFSKTDLLRKLQDAKRTDPLFQNAIKALQSKGAT